MATNKKLNFGLLGKNIDYSFSPGYFTKKFERENLPHCSYRNFDCATVEEVLSTIQRKDLKGLNVTIPYKEAVIPAMDTLSPTASAIGAVLVSIEIISVVSGELLTSPSLTTKVAA